jgi:hypothetical protein
VNVTGGDHITKGAHLGDANQLEQDKDLADETMDIDAHDSNAVQVDSLVGSDSFSGNGGDVAKINSVLPAPDQEGHLSVKSKPGM